MRETKSRPQVVCEFAVALVVYPCWGFYVFWRDLVGGLIFEAIILRQNWNG